MSQHFNCVEIFFTVVRSSNMNLARKVWVLSLFVVWTHGIKVEDISNVILEILEDLRNENPERFDCTLYQPYPTTYADRVVQLLLTSSTFKEIPILQLGSHFVDPIFFQSIRLSSVVIWFLENPAQV